MNIEIENKLVEAVGQVAPFVKEQTTDIINQYIAYYTYSNILGIILFLVLITTIVFGFRYLLKNCNIDEYDKVPILILSSIIGGLLICIFTVALICDIDNLIKVTTAPKIVVLDKIAELTK